MAHCESVVHMNFAKCDFKCAKMLEIQVKAMLEWQKSTLQKVMK